jgi:hypothetical protein
MFYEPALKMLHLPGQDREAGHVQPISTRRRDNAMVFCATQPLSAGAGVGRFLILSHL